ncbi:type II toxin-antitoxin system RatA family toxin [Parachitinimonas caeni]|uniref:Type II toxin-antitoxin system RatA family toxin n=1 Tax=Parachitinimonas caeni TaxID=3031301 RepID=A0ABT7DZX4_9NEIS|nr:type II toxin-antitoxin system RatA family toxin [Parachitinimonas caeni]MDK2125616.1 type II toxin-antitoxin system RatA family toxin [Parachitinimonas caeni]
MPQIKKLVLVEFSAAQMFELVDRVEDYPGFLPWCGFSEVHSRDDLWTVATLGIDYLGLRQQFTTENRKSDNQISLELKDGPFRNLTGAWRFVPLAENACKVVFELEYEFANRTLENLVGPVFNKIANSFVDAFVKQAEKRFI